MYDNVIVPDDGSLSARDALGPASDFAWRCNARVVIVNNTEATDPVARNALKMKAKSMSGSDVDYWIDTEHTIAENLLEASRHRPRSIICIPIREKRGVLLRKPLLTETSADVLLGSRVPVMVVGPEVDVSRGLSLSEVVVPLDGSTLSEHVLPIAAHWAQTLRMRLSIIGVVPDNGDDHAGERTYLQDACRRIAEEVTDAGFELIESSDPVAGIVGFVADRPNSIVLMSSHGRGGVDDHPLGSVARETMLKSPQVVVFHRSEN